MDLPLIAMVYRTPDTYSTPSFSALNAYLHSAVTNDFRSLYFLRAHEHLHPGLPQRAKNILAVAIASVGIKLILSIASQIYSYQKNLLNAYTIMQFIIICCYEQLMATDNQDFK